MERRYRAQAQPAGLHTALLAAGHEVTVLVTDPVPAGQERPDWSAYDVVVARGRGPQLLAQLSAAAEDGVATLNSAAAVASVVDKASMGRALRRAGLPIPRTRCGPPAVLASADWRYPVICKPVRGDNARGIRVVHDRAELAGLDWPEPTAIVQEFLAGDGRDLKLYGIGDQVWAVRRASPLTPDAADVPEPVTVTPALRAIARRAARAFGLELYGVDCLLTPEGPVVLELNDFPNYTGVPDAGAALADYVTARAMHSATFRKALPCASR